MNLKALPLVVVLSISSVFQLMAQPLMTMLPDEAEPGKQRLIWSTEPGIRYELQETSNIDEPESWTTVAGYPTEAEALAQQAIIELNAPDRKFYRVVLLDEQPPEIVSLAPAADAFGVGRFSSVTVTLDDLTGVDPSSISLTVADHGTFTLVNEQLEFEHGALTFWLGGDMALGGWGHTVTVSLAVADIAGNVSTNGWSFILEVEPVLEGDVFVFGSPEAQRAGQKLTDSQRAIANRTAGRAPMPMSDPQNPWTLEEVGDNHILLSYQGSTPPSFSVDQRLVNLAPVREHEIFYRKVSGVEVNTTEQTVLLITVNVPLWEIVAEFSRLFIPATTIKAIFEILEDGLLVDVGGSLEIGAAFDQTFEFSEGGTTASFGLGGGFSFIPQMDVAFNIHDKQLEDLYIKAGGTLTAHAEFFASVSGRLKRSYTPRVPFFRHDHTQMLGMAGPVPIWVKIRFSLNAEVGVNLDATTGVRYEFYYQRYRSFAATYSPRAPELNGWKTENFSVLGSGDSSPEFTTDISGDVWAELIPEIDIRLMHVAGVKAAIPAGVALDANASFSGGELTDYNWAITAYIDLRGDISVFAVQEEILPFSYRFFERQWAGPPTPEIVILDHPKSQTVRVGDSVDLAVTANGPGVLSYRWYHNGVLVPGQTQSTLHLPYVNHGHAGQYAVRVENSASSLLSIPAILTVGNPGIFYYEASLSGSWNIYEADIHGNVVSIASSPASDLQPQLSHDGAFIAFRSDRNSTRSDLWIMRRNGSSLRQLTDSGGAMDFYPRFSTDRTQIAFASYRPWGAGGRVMLIDFAGDNERELYYSSHHDTYPVGFVNGGQHLLMLRQLRYGAGDVRLFRIHNDGSGLTELTNISSLVGYAGEVVGAGGPQINSSESKILFEYRSGSDNRIYMMDSNGQNVELVAGPEGSPAAPYWTPKGNFTYSALNSESGRRELYLRNTISGGTSTVIASPDADYNMGILVE